MKRLFFTVGMVCAVSCALAQQGVADTEFGDVFTAAEGQEVAVSAAGTAAAAVVSAVVSATATAAEARGRLETGIASWYGGRFHGRKTASGEAFDMDALTAAHPKLPFGSWVRVKNLVNGRSVDVRINDRGPHVGQRIIDLSRAAAQVLGVAGHGLRQVELTLLQRRDAVTPAQIR